MHRPVALNGAAICLRKYKSKSASRMWQGCLYQDIGAAMWEIRAESASDDAAVERLVDAGFGPGRFAKTAYRLREGVAPDARLSFVAENPRPAVLLGAVRFWPVIVGQSLALLLGPLAVDPKLRGRGIGIALMQRGLEEARVLGFESVVL